MEFMRILTPTFRRETPRINEIVKAVIMDPLLYGIPTTPHINDADITF